MNILGPIEAYDRLAVGYTRLSGERSLYLRRVEHLIASDTPAGSRSLLDIGAGDGTRALRLAALAGLTELTLLEPSEAMRRLWPTGTRGWPLRAEELDRTSGAFDIITCLWNVLGHVFPAAARVETLRNCARLLMPGGVLFVDVSHRYNARHYGVLPTLWRAGYDCLRPAETNGDVTASWEMDGATFATRGHVFTDVEFRNLAAAAGLSIYRRFAINYKTGRECRSIYGGHLLYACRAVT